MDALRTLEIRIRPPLHHGEAGRLAPVLARHTATTMPALVTPLEVSMPGVPPRGELIPPWGPDALPGATPEPRSRLAASALPGGAALWDLAHRFRTELGRLHEEGRRLRTAWRRMATLDASRHLLHVDLSCSLSLARAYGPLLQYVLHLFFGRLASPARPSGRTPAAGPRTAYGLDVTWSLRVDDALCDEPIPAYTAMLKGTQRDHGGPEKLRAFMLSGQADWAVHFGIDLATPTLAADCWPNWFGPEHLWLHLRDLRWHMLGGQLSKAPCQGTRRTERRAALDGEVPFNRGGEVGVVGDLPSLAFLDPPEPSIPQAPPGWRRSPRTMQDWVALLRMAHQHPWRVPGTLGGTIPATRMSALLTFQAGASLLRSATHATTVGGAEHLWILRHAQTALLLAFRALIEQGDLPGMLSTGLWLARVYAELGHAGDTSIPTGLGGPEIGATPDGWLALARERVESAADLLQQAGRGEEEAAVRGVWWRLQAAVQARAPGLVHRYARALVGLRADDTATDVDREPRLLLLGGAALPGGTAMREIPAPSARPERDPEPWTTRRAHAVVVRSGVSLTPAEVERWFPNGDAPVLSDAPATHEDLPHRQAVQEARHRRSAPAFDIGSKGAPRDWRGKPPVFVNFPADPAYARFKSRLEHIARSANFALRTDWDEASSEPERRQRIVGAVKGAIASIHDLSRYSGQGPMALARMNMPFELGLAMGQPTDDQRILILVDAGEPIESYLSDIPASRGFLVRGYRGTSAFERAIRDALWVWGCPTAWAESLGGRHA